MLLLPLLLAACDANSGFGNLTCRNALPQDSQSARQAAYDYCTAHLLENSVNRLY
jgi:hypothetical protein